MSNNDSSIHFIPLESKVCPRCNGSKHEPNDREKVCQLCFGTGIASSRTQSVVIPPLPAADLPTMRMSDVHLSSTSVVRIARTLREMMRNPTGTWPSIKAAIAEQPSLRRTFLIAMGTMFVLFAATLVFFVALLPGSPHNKSTVQTALATQVPTSTATMAATATIAPTSTPPIIVITQPTTKPQPTATSAPTATSIPPTPTLTPVPFPLTVSPASIIESKSACLSSSPPSVGINIQYNDPQNGPTLYWTATSNASYTLNGGSTTSGALNLIDSPELLNVTSIKKSGVVTVAPSDGVSFPKQTVTITCQ